MCFVMHFFSCIDITVGSRLACRRRCEAYRSRCDREQWAIHRRAVATGTYQAGPAHSQRFHSMLLDFANRILIY